MQPKKRGKSNKGIGALTTNIDTKPSRKRIGFKINTQTQKNFQKQIIEDGYTSREKSQWIEESIIDLLQEDRWPYICSAAYSTIVGDNSDVLTVNIDVADRLTENLPLVVKAGLEDDGIVIKGPQTAIILAAISNRLSRPGTAAKSGIQRRKNKSKN